MAAPSTEQRFIGKISLQTYFDEIQAPSPSTMQSIVRRVLPAAQMQDRVVVTTENNVRIFTMPFEVFGSFNAANVADALDNAVSRYVDSVPDRRIDAGEGELTPIRPYETGATAFGAASATSTNVTAGKSTTRPTEPNVYKKPPGAEDRTTPNLMPIGLLMLGLLFALSSKSSR